VTCGVKARLADNLADDRPIPLPSPCDTNNQIGFHPEDGRLHRVTRERMYGQIPGAEQELETILKYQPEGASEGVPRLRFGWCVECSPGDLALAETLPNVPAAPYNTV